MRIARFQSAAVVDRDRETIAAAPSRLNDPPARGGEHFIALPRGEIDTGMKAKAAEQGMLAHPEPTA